MRSVLVLLIGMSVGLLSVSCVTTEGASSGEMRANVGTSTPRAVKRVVPDMLQGEYGYRLEREATRSQLIRFVTYWNEHSLLEDERKNGYDAVRTRVRVTGQPKDRSAGTYRVTFEADYEVRRSGDAGWERADITPMREEQLGKIVRDLEEDLSSGVREY